MAVHPLGHFDARRLARLEKDNYVAYYQKDWWKLLRVSVGMVAEAFNLSLPQAIYAAWLVARAEIAFAPFPENNVPRAEALMRQFFAMLARVHHLDIQVGEAAQREVGWWAVHRQVFGQAENQALVEALAQAYASAFCLPAERLRPAAELRAQGMLSSDLWMNAGKLPNSPLLVQEEEQLYQAYRALSEAINDDKS